MEKIVLVSVCICSALFLVVGMLQVKQQEKNFKIKILRHNRDVIFASTHDLDLKKECFKSDEFFFFFNTGNDPCDEVKIMEYKRCFTKNDLYINIKTE